MDSFEDFDKTKSLRWKLYFETILIFSCTVTGILTGRANCMFDENDNLSIVIVAFMALFLVYDVDTDHDHFKRKIGK
jgi:hypothetical protein